MKFFGNVTKLEADIESTSQALQPVLEKAGIKTAMRDGKVIPLADATNAEKFSALMAAQPPGTELQARAELLCSNDTISKRCEKAESDLAIANTSVGTLTRENAQLRTDLATAQGSVKTLTEEKSNIINLRDAAVNQNSALNKDLSAQKLALTKKCHAVGCLDLKGADGKPLAQDATDEAVAAASKEISFESLVSSYAGALNSAAAKAGIILATLPGQGWQAATAPQQAELKGRARFKSTLVVDGKKV